MALAMAKGEGVFGMFVQSFSRICFYLGAMGRSHIGVEMMYRSSLAHCLGYVEEKRARKHVIVESSDCGRGDRMVGLAHCRSLSSMK